MNKPKNLEPKMINFKTTASIADTMTGYYPNNGAHEATTHNPILKPICFGKRTLINLQKLKSKYARNKSN